MAEFEKKCELDRVASRDSKRYALTQVQLDGEAGELRATNGRVCAVIPVAGVEAEHSCLLPREVFRQIREKGDGEFGVDEDGIFWHDKALGEARVSHADEGAEFPGFGPLVPSLAGRQVLMLNVAQLAVLAQGLNRDTLELHLPADLRAGGVAYVCPEGNPGDRWGLVALYQPMSHNPAREADDDGDADDTDTGATAEAPAAVQPDLPGMPEPVEEVDADESEGGAA